MDHCESAVEDFLEQAAECFGEYDDGYVDADAALRRLERHVEALRETVE